MSVNSEVKSIISDKAPGKTKTPLYAAYAFDIEYISPLLKTLNDRVRKLTDSVSIAIDLTAQNDYLQRDLNLISQYLTISLNENQQLRQHMIRRDK